MTEPTGSDFWAAQDMAARPRIEREQVAVRVRQLKNRQHELHTLIDDLEARGGSAEEWAAYGQAFAQWNNDVMDLVEETNTPLSSGVAQAPVTVRTHEAFVALLAGLDEPFDGNRRLGKEGYPNL